MYKLKSVSIRLSFLCLIVLGTTFHSTCICQGKVVEDPGSPPVWINSKSFGSMLKERFKDSIQGLDRMCFDILIDKKGKAKKVVFMKDYFSPSISAEDLKRITTYIKSSMQWKPAWVPSGKGIRNFECSTYEFVNLPYVDSIISQPPAPKQMKN